MRACTGVLCLMRDSLLHLDLLNELVRSLNLLPIICGQFTSLFDSNSSVNINF